MPSDLQHIYPHCQSYCAFAELGRHGLSRHVRGDVPPGKEPGHTRHLLADRSDLPAVRGNDKEQQRLRRVLVVLPRYRISLYLRYPCPIDPLQPCTPSLNRRICRGNNANGSFLGYCCAACCTSCMLCARPTEMPFPKCLFFSCVQAGNRPESNGDHRQFKI